MSLSLLLYYNFLISHFHSQSHSASTQHRSYRTQTHRQTKSLILKFHPLDLGIHHPRAGLESLQRQIEFIEVQEEYVKDEHKSLQRELLRAQEKVKYIQSEPLVIGQFIQSVVTACIGP